MDVPVLGRKSEPDASGKAVEIDGRGHGPTGRRIIEGFLSQIEHQDAAGIQVPLHDIETERIDLIDTIGEQPGADSVDLTPS